MLTNSRGSLCLHSPTPWLRPVTTAWPVRRTFERWVWANWSRHRQGQQDPASVTLKWPRPVSLCALAELDPGAVRQPRLAQLGGQQHRVRVQLTGTGGSQQHHWRQQREYQQREHREQRSERQRRVQPDPSPGLCEWNRELWERGVLPAGHRGRRSRRRGPPDGAGRRWEGAEFEMMSSSRKLCVTPLWTTKADRRPRHGKICNCRLYIQILRSRTSDSSPGRDGTSYVNVMYLVCAYFMELGSFKMYFTCFMFSICSRFLHYQTFHRWLSLSTA